jgi:hypothetical protein
VGGLARGPARPSRGAADRRHALLVCSELMRRQITRSSAAVSSESGTLVRLTPEAATLFGRGRDSGRAVEAALSRHRGGTSAPGRERVLAAMALRDRKGRGQARQYLDHLLQCYVHPEVLNSYMDGNLVLELTSKVESELRSDVQSLKPEAAATCVPARPSCERSRTSGVEKAARKRCVNTICHLSRKPSPHP